MDTPDEINDDRDQPWWRKRLGWLLAALLGLPALLKRLFAGAKQTEPGDGPGVECPPTAAEQRRRADRSMVEEHDVPLYYVAGLVVGPTGEAVRDDRLELLTTQQLSRVLGCIGADRADETAGVTALAELVNVYRIDARLDPRALSQELEGRVAPVHVMAPAVHWSFEPGESAKPFFSFLASNAGVTRRATDQNPEAIAATPLVAVVDTGYVPTGFAHLDRAVRRDPGIDDDTDGHGHGTFIASILRQVAPTCRISMARAATINPEEILRAHPPGEHEEDLPPDLAFTSELGVATAILRLIDRHKADAVDALVLSLGTWADELLETSALRLALEAWFASGPGGDSTVFAAAGNEVNEPELSFFPAALAQRPFERLRAVQPTLHTGEPVYWEPVSEQRLTFAGHKWATDKMLGVDILGVCGASAEECAGAAAIDANGDVARFASWSGASFATPIVAGEFVTNGGVVRDYADIPGLSYLPGT